MNRWTLLWRSLLHYRRAHFGVVLGVIIGTAVLTGALLVGDCVNATLRYIALIRLGDIHHALHHPTRFVTEELANNIEEDYQPTLAPGLYVQGMISLPSGGARANQVNVYGVDERFWELSAADEEINPFADITKDAVVLNNKLAEHLDAQPGDTLILRMQKPSAISRDAPLSTDEDSTVSLRMDVASVVDDEHMGRFDLRINQVPPMNAYLPLAYLQNEVEQPEKINMMLAADTPQGEEQGNDLKKLMRDHWTYEDAQLSVEPPSETPVVEVSTDRIFLDDYVPKIIQNSVVRANPISGLNNRDSYTGILTYLVNELSINGNATPYSMVSALSMRSNTIFPYMGDIGDDEIIINQWLADDQSAEVGDELTIKYYVMGQMRQLEEQSRAFTVKQIIPMDHPLCDPTLMPDFPGISGSENCRDWDPGFSIDVTKIRDTDEDYWDEFKGTPKAFITLKAGQDMWSNRYGRLTAVRFTANSPIENVRDRFNQSLHPEQVGLLFQPVRQQALEGVNQAINFAPLFAGFSFFLIVAALILVGLLFVFGIEQRGEETGTMLALGFTPKQIRAFYLLEGFILACIGSVIGVFVGLVYTKLMLLGLETVWSGAVNDTQFVFVVTNSTMLIGLFGGILMSVFAVWLTLRKQVRAKVQELLSGSITYKAATKKSTLGLWIGLVSLLGAVLLVALLPADTSSAQAGKFFGTGALLLIAAIGFVHTSLHRTGQKMQSKHLSMNTLGWRNNTRRTGRSMAVVGLLACGSFLVIAVGANKQDASVDANEPSSGTGGYEYWGELTIPLLHNLNTESGLDEFALLPEDVPDTHFTSLRILQGDDASCLNLSRAQTPRLFALNPKEFAKKGAFTFVQTQEGEALENGWNLLNRDLGGNKIPAVIDQATMLWALGKSIGDSLYYTNEKGQELEVVLMGAIANSIFQGGIIIGEDDFIKHYPSSSGYSLVLVETPRDQMQEIEETLTFALQDYGLQLVQAEERLAAFNAVQNTYLTIFQVLGGLGLILGSAGIGVVMLRNVLERRGELALMRAVGFTVPSLRKMIITEHGILLLIGLLCGVLAGAAAVVPSIISRGSGTPVLSVAITLLIMLASGWLWIWLASKSAMRGDVLDALRNE